MFQQAKDAETDAEKDSESANRYAKVNLIVKQIPAGRVATYGQIAQYVERVTPRMVGYAMAGLPSGSDVPWQRVINAQGRISPRGNEKSTRRQQQLLQEEGIEFDATGKVDLKRFRWGGPQTPWLMEHGFGIMPDIF